MPNATPWVWRYSNCFYWTQISFLSMRIRPSISWVGPGYNYTESSSSHQCVCILSCHLVCSNYFYLQQQFILFAAVIFYLQQLYWICCNFILFAATLFYLLQPYFISSNFILFSATLFNLQQLFYLQQLYFICCNLILFPATLFYFQQLCLICSNFFICSMSPVGHRIIQ